MFDSPRKLIASDFDSFRGLQGRPQEAKIQQKSHVVFVKSTKTENVDFVDPSLAKSLFLDPRGSQDGAPMRQRIDFERD